jgi:putative oxidoreductase
MKKLISGVCSTSNFVTHIMDYCSQFFALGIRCYLAHIFFWSGYLKIKSWQSTLYLFENEYQVPLISPNLAAYLGTAAELILPFFLLVGLGARIPAIALSIFNIVIVISYPMLLSSSGACMLKDNFLWGMAAAIIVFYGHGKLSLDYLLQKTVCPNYKF